MKKFLAVLCAVALLCTMATGCKKKNKDNNADPDVTGESVVSGEVVENESDTAADSETKTPETIDLDGDGVSDGVVIEGTPGFDPDEVHDDEDDITSTEPNDTVQSTVISEGGTEPDLWPEEDIPEDVPEFKDYEEMYPAIKDEADTATNWYLGFDATEEEYEAWLKDLEKQGYIESDKIVGFWGNGEQIINVSTEMYDGEFCVNIDIFKSNPVEYPQTVKDVFPAFTVSDSTLYGWYEAPGEEGEPNIFNVSYACGKNFDKDLAAYKEALKSAGFIVGESTATKEIDGKTYSVSYGDIVSAYEDCLEFTY